MLFSLWHALPACLRHQNAFQAYVAWHSAAMGEKKSFHLGTQILRRFLYSTYMWHISSDSGRTLQALTGKTTSARSLCN
jgi:hypothetical protein